MRKNKEQIPNSNEIKAYIHCGLCLKERPKNVSPQDYSRIEAGYTKWGIQFWCRRHEVNVCHIDFEGKSPFPANTTIEFSKG